LGFGTSHGQFGLLDSPRPGLGGSHHLPPYSIICVSTRRLHPNGSFSRDSQVGVPKLSRVGVPGLWTAVAPCPELGLGRALNQSYSSRQELFNAGLHSLKRRREEVDSQLLVVGSQNGKLTPDLSFAHNLGCRFQMGNARSFWTSTFQELFIDIKNTPRQGNLTPQIVFWVFGSLRGLHFPTFGSVSCILTLSPKVGLRQQTLLSWWEHRIILTEEKKLVIELRSSFD